MKRVALLCLGLAMGAANAAEAQLTMQMSNGWSFTFAGNVNAFAIYETQSDDGATVTPGGLVPAPARRRASASAPACCRRSPCSMPRARKAKTDLGVHFGFAPADPVRRPGVHDCFGAQIDMRQVFLTVGGTWGQILAGRELGLFSRQNILTDQTLFGVGATGGIRSGGGTTLGRIGFGYIYPQFRRADDLLDARRPADPALDRSLRAASLAGSRRVYDHDRRSRGSRPSSSTAAATSRAGSAAPRRTPRRTAERRVQDRGGGRRRPPVRQRRCSPLTG